MDTMLAYANAQAAQGKPMRCFDWNKAAQLIKERGIQNAEAGLQSDLEWTGGEILRDGKPVTDSYTYLSSNWATPVLIVDGEEIECFCTEQDSGWDSDTKWPESALAILSAT